MKFWQKYKGYIITGMLIIVVCWVLYSFFWKVEIDKKTMDNKNVTAFLKMIRACEGTDNAKGYNTIFGYKYFTDFSKHPQQRQYFRNPKTGKQDYSDAAGAYQFISTTWARIASRLSLTDFSPASQDKGAIETIRENNALEDVVNGNFEIACKKLKNVWASLPTSQDKQNPKSWAFALANYQNAGGNLA